MQPESTTHNALCERHIIYLSIVPEQAKP
ncbi:protein of unknown function [Serratia sp. Tan611]|nr:protein of unknown function [Serratia sp. Tan611]